MTLPLIVLLPLLAGTAAALIARRWGHRAPAWAVAAVTGLALALLLSEAPQVFAGHTLIASWPWLPELGLNLAFRLDGLAFMFALLILGIGLLIILYASYYLSSRDSTGKFFATPHGVHGGHARHRALGERAALVVFWELTGITSSCSSATGASAPSAPGRAHGARHHRRRRPRHARRLS
jgi:multicomponent K+:H+ antiporter subunit A